MEESLTRLAEGVLDGAPYERAVSATALGRELDGLRRRKTDLAASITRSVVGRLKARGQTLEDALLDLVGYASRQQELWRAWTTTGKLPELSVNDATRIRQNCAGVLALIVALLSSTNHDDLLVVEPMRRTPESVTASAHLLRKAISTRRKEPHHFTTNRRSSVEIIEVPPQEDEGESLHLEAASPDVNVERKFTATIVDRTFRRTNQKPPSLQLASYLSAIDDPRPGLRLVGGGWRRPREALVFRRPAVRYLSDVVPLPDVGDDRHLGYGVPQLVVPAKRPTPLSPLGPRNDQIRRPVSSSAIVREYTSLTAIAYAKKLPPLQRPLTPLDVGRALAWSPNRGVRSTTTTTSPKVDVAEPKKRTEEVRKARAERKVASGAVYTAAREAKTAWREARMEAIVNVPSLSDDAAMAKVAKATEIERLAEEKLVSALRNEVHAVLASQRSRLPLTLLARFDASRCSPEERFEAAMTVRRRLQRILGRWVDEFEKAQMTVAFMMWRVNGPLEAAKEQTWASYRRHGAVAKLQKLLAKRRLKLQARALARLVSRTAWLIFSEREKAALKIATFYRRLREARLFLVRHDIMMASRLDDPTTAYYTLGVDLGVERPLTFRIHPRLRTERRKLWTASRVIQTRQRRNVYRVFYKIARWAAIRFEACARRWPRRWRYLRWRDCAIQIEAFLRVVLFRPAYLRLQDATREAQRVVRGHFGRMLFLQLLLRRRRALELRVSAPCRIQQVWRGFLSRRRVREMRDASAEEHLAGLRLQLAWYRNRGVFPTFLLLSCLRVSDQEDKDYAKWVRLNARRMAQRVIAGRYRRHLRMRRQEAAKRIAACWRGRVCLRFVTDLRREKWARRKLQHFVRIHMKRRHSASRRIAFFWWLATPGRLRRHLERQAAKEEKTLVEKEHRIFHQAAATIQAIIHGELTRLFLKRDAASIKLQCYWRRKLAYMRARRRRREKKLAFVAKIVARVTRHAVFGMMNTFRRGISAKVTKVQALLRGWLTRRSLHKARSFAQSIVRASLVIQRLARNRARQTAATLAVARTRRSQASVFQTCASVESVLSALRKDVSFDPEDFWAGVGPHAVCRRSGCVDALAKAPKTLAGLSRRPSRPQLARLGSSRRSTEVFEGDVVDDSLDNAAALARAILQPHSDVTSFRDCGPLQSTFARYTAAVLVCAAQYAEVSLRRIDDLDCHEDIFDVIQFEQLPYPCRKFVTAFAEEAEKDASPRDVSLLMLRRFCAQFPDADKALRGLKSGEFVTGHWIPGAPEQSHDKGRIQRAFETRREALERVQTLVPSGLVGSTAGDALDSGTAVLAMASQTGRPKSSATKLLQRATQVVMAVFSTQRSAATKKKKKKKKRTTSMRDAAPSAKKKTSSSSRSELATTLAKRFQVDNVETLLDSIPGICGDDASVAYLIGTAVYARALKKLETYASAAGPITAIARIRLSRRMCRAMQHAHFVSRVERLYLRERSGEAMRSAWDADMRAYKEQQAKEDEQKAEAERRRVTETRLSTILRLGWTERQIRHGQLEGTLRESVADQKRSTLVTVYERPRPPKPLPRRVESNFRDDDAARDPSAVRVIVDDRERQLQRPLYEVLDDDAALRIQNFVRQREATKVLESRRRNKVRLAREARERKEWHRRKAERLRHVTVRLAVEYEDPEVSSPDKKRTSDPRETSAFVDETELERGVHVLARFRGIPEEHWYGGTIFETGPSYGIVFEDGDVLSGVDRRDIRVPRLSVGMKVEARYKGGDFFDAVIVDVDDLFKVKYDDGDIEGNVPRTRLRIKDIETLVDKETRHLQYLAAVERKKKRDQRARDLKRRKEERKAKERDEIRQRFHAARAVRIPEDVRDRFRRKSPHVLDPHAMALAEMATCVAEMERLARPECVVKVRIAYTRMALRFGWKELDAEKKKKYYAHKVTGETTWERPAYEFDEELAAKDLQRAARRMLRRRDMERCLGSSHVPDLVRETRLLAASHAWTPSGNVSMDRVPLELWMARRGFGNETISAVVKVAGKHAVKIAAHLVTSRTSDSERQHAKRRALDKAKTRILNRFRQNQNDKQLEALGLTDPADRKWLRTTTTEDTGRFIAYWRTALDDREMPQVLSATELYVGEIEKLYKNQRARAEHMAADLSAARYPVTVAQLRRLAADFDGKPAAFQEALHTRVINVPTTATAPAELEALRIFVAGATRAKQLFERKRLSTLVTLCDRGLATACGICKPPPPPREGGVFGALVQQQPQQGGGTSGAAARACWVLDDEILEVALKVWNGAIATQAAARRSLARRAYIARVERRFRGATTMQQAWRTGLARRLASLYRAQQRAKWHMLWDDGVQAFYFMDMVTAQVTWEEPTTKYRPQVKDRFTGRYVLAWPQLDRPKPLHLQQPEPGRCMVCKVEEATRRCTSCPAPTFEGKKPKWGDGGFHFCFACFVEHHDATPSIRSHTFQVTKPTVAPPLRCCVCSELATRQCKGLRLQPRGREILQKFFHGILTEGPDGLTATTLRTTLHKAGIPVSVARAEELHETSSKKDLATYQAQVITALDAVADECSDFYCEPCWSETHAKGPRSLHAWTGFAPNAPVCALCEANVATLHCEKCNDDLCEKCGPAAHETGKNKDHVLTVIREDLGPGDTYCQHCLRRRGTSQCPVCAAQVCNSCLEFTHPSECPRRGTAKAISLGVDKDNPIKCAVCGRRPDSKCLECDEFYCTWMGKPRCFVKHHSRGKHRIDHTLVPYTILADIDTRLVEEEDNVRRNARALQDAQAKQADDFRLACEQALKRQRDLDRLVELKASDLLANRLRNDPSSSSRFWDPWSFFSGIFFN